MTAIDSNVIVAFWDVDPVFNAAARKLLEEASSRDQLLISAPVFAELLASPGRTERVLEGFLSEANITVDWTLGETIWRAAGIAFQGYAARRRRQRDRGPRRLLADFLIGAHAKHRAGRLLTFDPGIYRASFPDLRIVTI